MCFMNNFIPFKMNKAINTVPDGALNRVYVVVSEDEYGGCWTGGGGEETTCDNCENKRFIPKIFLEKHVAEEYAEQYMNSYVDCFNEINDNNTCCCKFEIYISEIQTTACDDCESLFVTVSSAPYGGALQMDCLECNGTEFVMKVFGDRQDAEQYVNVYIADIAPPCKSCMYNYFINIVEIPNIRSR